MTAFAWPGNEDAPPLELDQARDIATRLQALADPHRVRILSLIAAKEPVPMTTSEVIDQLGLSQSTVSHHLKQLVTAGFLTLERRGTWSLYRSNPAALSELSALIAPAE